MAAELSMPGSSTPLPPHPRLQQPMMEDLGDGRYRVGQIEIDRESAQFSVTGRMLPLESEGMPIEFLAVTMGSSKAYEALIELEASAVEFNLACILIGLDPSHATRSERHFDERRLDGDVVDITVSWLAGDTRITRELAQLLNVRPAQPAASAPPVPDGARSSEAPVTTDAQQPAHVWVYTGSFFFEGGDYAASQLGTLIGVVHDPWSIIQHQDGLGLGHYGAVTANHDLSPPADTRMTISVARVSTPTAGQD
jgi:hypothetical protein